MNGRRLSSLAAATGGMLMGEDREFRHVTQDTRKLAQGDLFVALRGEHADGHDYLPQAESLGAAGALVQHKVASRLPQVVVGDVREALGRFAATWRGGFDLPLIGVTGSSGKTTVKEMLASILRLRGETLATQGNMNNDIGMPLTLLELDAHKRYAVIEMGTNHPGEIAYLARIASPTVGLVTNAGPAHLEFLGDVAGVAKEKGAMLENVRVDGVAIYNADDAYAPLWREMAGRHAVRTFGLSPDADFHPAPNSLRPRPEGTWQFRLVCAAGETDISPSLPGRHNVHNALAAAAAAVSAGASLSEVREGLSQAPATKGRLVVTAGWNGSRLIDDTYNANPLSLMAAMEFSASLGGRVWLALGDMGELGGTSAQLHAECGSKARILGIERLYAFGLYSRHAADTFGPGGRWFDDVNNLVRALRAELNEGVTVLVKGSRSMRMERVVEALRQPPAVERAANGE